MNLTINFKTHLFICFLEELNELIEAYLNIQYDNLQDLFDEYNDLIGVMELLRDNNIDLFSYENNLLYSDSEVTNYLLKIQKFGFKAIRFGFDDSYPNSNNTNLEQIIINLSYVEHIFKNKFNFYQNRTNIDLKKERVLYYIQYAKDKGTLK